MRKLLLAALVAVLSSGYLATTWAAQIEVTFASVFRPTQNDDGSAYDPTPGSIVWQCQDTAGALPAIEVIQTTTELVPDTRNPGAVGSLLSTIFAGAADGTYTCIAREQNAATPPLRSNPSNVSEPLEKRGALFLVTRVVPNAPSGPILILQ